MFRRQVLAAFALVAALFVLVPAPTSAKDLDPENTLLLELKDGTVQIEMLPEIAPKHVAQIKTLVRAGFYDGLVWHRVMEGFMAQTGDPTGTGRGDSDLPNIKAEFSMEPFTRGAVGMARSSDPDSGNSQWFICLADCRFLDGQYTVWGRVVEGMEYVDEIKKAPKNRQSGMVDDPDHIISMHVMKDMQ